MSTKPLTQSRRVRASTASKVAVTTSPEAVRKRATFPLVAWSSSSTHRVSTAICAWASLLNLNLMLQQQGRTRSAFLLVAIK
eukprot:CAMPEP_0172584596 /NCGR_PEP_ID=MMETSP1068-20121228/4211_1 /TAXON_ID=35684 /ORGANISM="Pseudopedinella elastica, Strain CCMP716" /LENGTH=81 /DNA_ID=CAMNT_0013378843 /DNA_START=268 /DNA_END=513 /DNA_ORIENTATION=-